MSTETDRSSKPALNCEQQLQAVLGEVACLANYARSEGKALPPNLVEDLTTLCEANAAREKSPELGATPPDSSGDMLRHALAVHGQLSTLLAPVTAKSIAATELWRGWLIKTPLVWVLLSLGVLSLVVYIFTVVRLPAEHASRGAAFHLNLLAAAGLGAAFYSLFSAYRYIVERTYDPRYNVHYFARMILGLMAGYILASFGSSLLTGDLAVQLGTSVLAIVGGYAAEAVAQILKRVSDTLVTLVRGSGQDLVDAKIKEQKAQLATRLMEATKDLSPDVQKRLRDSLG